ncbi:MAG: type 12 methyltransferase, partial [uncultured bacterium]
YLPWGTLINALLGIIQKMATLNGNVIDLMCGPGYLLGEIEKRRTDLILEGIDINTEFIHYAQTKNPQISFLVADILSWYPTRKYDLVLCTGAIHHLRYADQASFLEMIPMCLNQNGVAIFADPYIDDYFSESGRKKAAAKLGYEYLIATIENGAPEKLVDAMIDVLHNDVLGFEYKTSLVKIMPIFKRLFSMVAIKKTWPKYASNYGEYYIICHK